MILCVLKQILHKKKVIFIQLLVSPILPCCLLLLFHKITKQRYSVKNMKNVFLRPLTMRKNVFWVSKNQNSMEKIGQNFHICLRSGLRWLAHLPLPPPYGQPDCKISAFFTPCLIYIMLMLGNWKNPDIRIFSFFRIYMCVSE